MTSPQGALSPLWAGNIPVDRLNTALRTNDTQVNATATKQDQRYWSTPARPATSTVKEVMRVALVGDRLINAVSFSVALFPHDLYLEYLDADGKTWLTCLDARSADPVPSRQSIRESHPSVIPTASMVPGHVHPQHGFSGHWRTLGFKIRAVRTTSIRLILQRSPDGKPPTNVFGTKVDYSLAVKDLSLGFQAETRDDIPASPPKLGSYTEYESFATSTDALGSKVDFSVRVNRASNTLQGQGGHATDTTLIWRSEPQPVPWSVVNFYADMRDADGSATLIDRFFIDPVYEGANLNLYWSNVDPTGAFAAPSQPLDSFAVSRHDGRGIKGNVLHGGASNKGYLAYVDIDNRAVNFDPSRRWWLGLNFNLKAPSSNVMPNPTFTVGADPWTAHNASTLTWESPGSLLVTSTTSATPTGAVAGPINGIQEGFQYEISADVTLLDSPAFGFGVDWLDDQGAYLSTSFVGVSGMPVGVETTSSVRVVSPEGANAARPFIDGGNINPGQRFRIHATSFVEADTGVVQPLLDFGEFNLAMTPLGLRLETPYGDNLFARLDAFDPATPVGVVVGYDGSTMYLRARVGSVDYDGQTRALSVPLSATLPPVLRIGSFLNTPTVSDTNLNAFVLKVDDDFSEDTAADFLLDQAPFLSGDRTGNALLRYDFALATDENTSGFLGGTPDRYDELKWEPVARDFVLRKGFLYFPPTKAKYWKLEFCGLTPEPYEVYKPIVRNVLSYPISMWTTPKESPTLVGASLNAVTPGGSTAINLGQINAFKDSTTAMGTGGNGDQPSATTARVVWDAQARQNVGSAYWAWNFLPLHSAPRTPRFEASGTHVYETMVVEHKTKLAYFVGLKTIEAYRLDYLSSEDTPQIIEMFHDLSNVGETNWVLTKEHLLSSGDAHFAEVTSKAVRSQRLIRAVQFAAQQSAPKQLLPDDDFTDTEQRFWQPVGDARLKPGIQNDAVLGTTIEVDRSLTEQSWGEIEKGFASWGDLAAVAVTWDAIERAVILVNNIGGITSTAVTTPPGGRVYAAARVVAPNDLINPLSLQVVDDVTGRILSDERITVKGNQVTEWFGSFTINDITQPRAWRWGDFVDTSTGPNLFDTFVRPDAADLSTMDTGQIWSNDFDASGNPLSLNIVNNRAKVVTAGDRNWFDANSLWGTLEVAVGAMGTGTTGVVDLIEFAPVTMAETGKIYFEGFAAGTSSSVLGRAVQANDVIRVDIMPTTAVPSNLLPANTDPVVNPYALVFYLNGTFTQTVVHAQGARTIRAIKGRLGQEFTRFSWTPKAFGTIYGNMITRLPHDTFGGYVASPPPTDGSSTTAPQTFLDNDGRRWLMEGTWDTASATESPGFDTVGLPFTASSMGAVAVTECDTWYGTLSAYVRNVASTESTGDPHGWVLCLDYDQGIFLDYSGSIVDRDGINYGTLVPGGIPIQSVVMVQFARTSALQVANRGGFTPAQAPDQIVAYLNGTIVGRYVGPMLDVWRGTRRGVAGDAYIGARPSIPNYILDTSFRALMWAPDISNIALNAAAPTWDNVTNGGRSTYEYAVKHQILTNPRLRVQLVQHGESVDRWSIDTLSLYVDPIMWSFSIDGGYTWYPALDIRSNPNGVLAFPQTVIVNNAGQKVGTSIMWRATSYAPQTHISSLVIRPWYGGTLSGITNNVGLAQGGPNAMPYDHFGDIRKDARFQGWSRPIPQDWWHAFRILRRTGDNQSVNVPLDLYPSADLYPSGDLYPSTSNPSVYPGGATYPGNDTYPNSTVI